MATINILDKKVYNRISAGEVVERPSSVIKELVENAIDAGATEISVSIENGGIACMTVRDNGSGVSRAELSKVFLPHATSKIVKAEDLDKIMTLGFRGEALASIGAVARCTFTSKTQEQEVGASIDCDGGEMSEVYDCPTLKGSVVCCRDLFFNTPARGKFLKTPKSEESDIVGIMTKMALSCPHIAFRLTCDGNLQLETFGGGLKECIGSIYGMKTLENCYMIEQEKNGITVSGFIGKLNFTKPTRSYQTLIVNGRYVTDSTVTAAITNAYGSYLMKRQYPFYVLELTVPPEAVDVNVHPRKAEVRFSNNQIIYGAVYSTVSKVIDGTSAALEIIKEDGGKQENSLFDNSQKQGYSTVINTFGDNNTTQNAENKAQTKEENVNNLNAEKGDAFTSAFSEGKSATFNLGENKEDFSKKLFAKKADKEEENKQSSYKSLFSDSFNKKGFSYAKNTNGTSVSVFDSCYEREANKTSEDIFAENKKYIEKLEKEKNQSVQQQIPVEPTMFFVGQAFNTYLIFQYSDDLYLIDQHAAHERMLFDELCEKAKLGMLTKQPLLLPYVFKVPREDFDSIYGRFTYFRELGIEIDIMGDDTFKVSSVPSELCSINLKEFFDDLMFDNAFKQESIPLTLKEKLMQTACKHAIKGGDSLDKSEIDALMAKIKGNFGLKCPHGRPIAVKIAKTEIEKWFKRIV